MYLEFAHASGTRIVYDGTNLPAWVFTDAFSIGGWFLRTSAASVTTVTVEGLFSLRIAGANNAFRVIAKDGATVDVHEVTRAAGSTSNWRFVLASWDPSTGTIAIHVVDAPSPSGQTNSETDSEFATGPDYRDLVIGGSVSTDWIGSVGNGSGYTGLMGPVCIRRGVTGTLSDAVAMFASRDIMAPLRYSGGDFDGLSDDLIAFCTGFVGSPINAGVSPQRGSRFGTDVRNGDFLIYDSSSSNNAQQKLIEARPVTVAGGMVYKDHRTVDGHEDFFVLSEPGVTTDGTVGNSMILARIAQHNVDRLYKVAAWSNSRGMYIAGGFFAPGQPNYHRLPGNHASGMVAALLDRNSSSVTGTISAKLGLTGSGGAELRRQFIFDGVGGPWFDGTINGLPSDFARFWTGGDGSTIIGGGLRVRANTDYEWGAAEESGTPFLKSAPIRYVMHRLRYPGAPDFTWSITSSTSQSSQGTALDPPIGGSVTGDDTTEVVHAFNESNDSYTSGTRTLVLDDEYPEIEVGWAINLVGLDTIAEVESVDVTGGQTTIVLRHVFDTPPADETSLRIGPWLFADISVVIPATSNAVRKMRITTGTHDHGDVCLLGSSAWLVDEQGQPLPGVAMMAAGTGGAGYSPQMELAVANLATKITQHLGLDVVMLHEATQSSVPADRRTFAALVEAGGAEAVLCSDMVHTLSPTGAWSTDILGQSDYAGVIAQEACGTFDHRIAIGAIHDVNHPSLPGMIELANNMLVLIEQDFIDPPRFNGNALCLPDTDPDPTGTFRPVLRFVESEGRVLDLLVMEPGGPPNGHSVEFVLFVNIDGSPFAVATVPIDGDSAPATMVAFMAEVAEQAAEYTTPITLDIALADGIDADAAPVDVLRLAQSNLGLDGTAYLVGNAACTPASERTRVPRHLIVSGRMRYRP